MMYSNGAQSRLDMLFLRKGHSAGGRGAPLLITTHCHLFFMQDGGCSCPGDVAKAFGKDSA